jgi:tetratricopeptide (TPR) repeat protein
MKRITALLIAGVMFHAPMASSQQMHSHPAPEKLGKVSFATSCSPKVAHDFERAVALLHSFAYTASEKAFSDIALADPACAMAHWGIAMSYYHQLWSPPEPDELAKGEAEAEKASRLPAPTERERLFIAAISAYYRDADHVPPAARAKAYEAAMAKAAERYPADTEVQVFHALSLVGTASPLDKTHANQKRAGAILEPIYRDHPDHPGVAHYLIHTYDSTELAPRGLAAARAYSKIAPSAPHALHMPSHIFTRLGLWDESIESNKAARAAAHSQGDFGEELHAMDYLTYAYLQRGRRADAEAVVQSLSTMGIAPGSDFKAGYAATAMPVRMAMEGRQWDAASKLAPEAGSSPEVAAIVYWARAVGRARSGHPQPDDEDIAKLETCRQQLTASGKAYWATQVEILAKESKAWQLAAQSHPDQAIEALGQAADQEDGIEKLPLTPGPIIPAREQLGDMLLAAHRPKEALEAYRVALAAAPGRHGALEGAAKAADAVGDTRTANQMRGLLSNR